jgi:hypothetical protein
MDQSPFIAKHVINLPKSGIRDFFEIVSKISCPAADSQNPLPPVITCIKLHP